MLSFQPCPDEDAHLCGSRPLLQLSICRLQRSMLLCCGPQLLLGRLQGSALHLVAHMQLRVLALQGIQLPLQQAVALLQRLDRVHKA